MDFNLFEQRKSGYQSCNFGRCSSSRIRCSYFLLPPFSILAVPKNCQKAICLFRFWCLFFQIFFVNQIFLSLLNCVPCVLKTCSPALRAHLPTCLVCLRVHVPTYLRAQVPCVLKCSRANTLCVLTCSLAHVPTWIARLRAHMLTC